MGSLVHYITHADANNFQPANMTFDLLEPLEEELRKKVRDKKERHRLQCERSLAAFDAWWSAIPPNFWVEASPNGVELCAPFVSVVRCDCPGKVSYAVLSLP